MRNIAAHEIVAVTEEWIKARASFGTWEILEMMQRFLAYCIKVPEGAWDSYDKQNEAIASMTLMNHDH